jgi:hypothetical protein
MKSSSKIDQATDFWNRFLRDVLEIVIGFSNFNFEAEKAQPQKSNHIIK